MKLSWNICPICNYNLEDIRGKDDFVEFWCRTCNRAVSSAELEEKKQPLTLNLPSAHNGIELMLKANETVIIRQEPTLRMEKKDG